MKTRTRSVLALARTAALLAQIPLAAHAGRPLATDDAGTAGAHTCQVESWIEHAAGSHARRGVVSPACGWGDAFEVGIELARSVPDDGIRLESGLSLKWVDPAWKAGSLNWGLKAWHSTAHGHRTSRTAPTASGAMGLLTWRASQAVAVHGNLGFEKSHHAGRGTEPLLHLAVSWEAAPALTLAAEAMALRHSPAWLSLGARWWLRPERLALDATAGRGNGAEPARNVSVGLGWYGIGW